MGIVMTQQTAEPPSASATASLVEQLTNAEAVEKQLLEHWEEYAVLRDKLAELRASQDSLRFILEGVKSARSTGQGLDATLALLINGHAGIREDDAWRERVWTLAREAVAEVLINTALHSGATSTNAGLKRHADWLLISVADNGRGGAAIAPGGGLHLIQERVRLGGGLFSLDSQAGTGTTVTIALPLVEPTAAPAPHDQGH